MFGSENWFACVICGAVIRPGSMLVVASEDNPDGTAGKTAAFDEDHWPPHTGEWRVVYKGDAGEAPADLKP